MNTLRLRGLCRALIAVTARTESSVLRKPQLQWLPVDEAVATDPALVEAANQIQRLLQIPIEASATRIWQTEHSLGVIENVRILPRR